MTKQKQWNLKNVPTDIYEKVMKIQVDLKIKGSKTTSIEQICFALLRKGAGITKEDTTQGKQV